MRTLTLLTFILLTLSANAQFKADGSLINNFQMHTLSGDTIDAYELNAQGKHIVIDFSATWCIACWNYHGTNVLEDYYNNYGPMGSISQDAQVVFYEGDGATNYNDMIGTGTNTLGDWTMNVTHPICNEADPFPVRNQFVVTPNAAIPFPSVVVLCADSRFFKLSTSTTSATDLRAIIDNKCASPNGIAEFADQDFTLSIYPNPTNGDLNIEIDKKSSKAISYQIMSSTGQALNSNELGESQRISTSHLAPGFYFLRINLEDSFKTARFIVQ